MTTQAKMWRIRHFMSLRVYSNFLPADCRYIGYSLDWYDGPIYCFGFWYFHIYATAHD